MMVNATWTMPTQTMRGNLVPVAFGTTISGVAVDIMIAAAGTLPTGVFVALYDLAGNQLAVSADVKALANWNVTGLKSFPFTTPWVVTQDGAVYACILKNGVYGTTEPQIGGVAQNTGTGSALGANAPAAVFQAGQATPPSPATLVANDSFQWFGLV
jgi:hypothetical protein